jgi:hypothetical protein
MAQTGTTAPKKGRKTNAELQKENSALERKLQEKKAVNGLWVTTIGIILVLAAVIGGIWFYVSQSSDNTADEPTPMPASLEERGVGYISGSWGEVKQTLQDPDVRALWDPMNVAMAEYRGFLIPDEAIADHLVREVELADPDRYVWTADRGLTGWLNTNWDRIPSKIFGDSFQVGDQFLLMEVDILAKYGVDISKIPVEALVTLPDGTVCVIVARAVCTNHVWPGVSPQVRVRYCDHSCHHGGKLPMYSGPLQTPHDPDNPFTQDDPAYDVTETTDNYDPGNAEAVEQDRGLGDDATGEAGTGSGGDTLGGSTTIGGVTIVTDGEDPGGVVVDGDSGVAVEPPVTIDPEEWGND